ncbi:beta-N-acetylhexosaminidase [Fervidobacterium sp.]
MDLKLLPKPKVVKVTGGALYIPKSGYIYTTNEKIGGLCKSIAPFESFIVTKSTKNDEFVKLIVNPDILPKPESYKLIINESITIVAHDDAGLYYGVQTLKQILRQSVFSNSSYKVPQLYIEDYPDFSKRGIMIDISRDRIPKIETLKMLIEKLSEFKINQVQLYMEHTFAYRNHEKVWKEYSPLTHEEIIELDLFCRERFIELVPNQNTFGHLSKWLVHEEYRHLAEAPDGHDYPWGGRYEYPFSISPVVSESIEFVSELLNELLPNFSSAQVNIGCDETFDLGQGKSKEICERMGKGKVYFDFLMKIYNVAKRYKNTVMFWGDIIENHPEFIGQLPRDMIAMVWGYEANHPFEEKCQLYSKCGLSFYVCPGTSTWNTFIGRTDNAIENIKSAIYNGYKYGAIGVLTTDWGDNGHPQHLPFSWIGYVYSATLSWNVGSIEMLKVDELLESINQHVFETQSNVAQLIHKLGLLHNKLPYTPNGTPYFYAFIYPERFNLIERIDGNVIDEITDNLKEIENQLDEFSKNDERLFEISEQIKNNIAFARLGLKVLKYLKKYGNVQSIPEHEWSLFESEIDEVIMEYRRIWVKWNRPGGIDQSIHKLTRIKRVRNGDMRGLIF